MQNSACRIFDLFPRKPGWRFTGGPKYRITTIRKAGGSATIGDKRRWYWRSGILSTENVIGNLQFDITVPGSARLRDINEGQESVRKSKINEMTFWKLIRKWADAKNRVQDLRVIPPETRLTVYRGPTYGISMIRKAGGSATINDKRQ